MMNKPFQGIRDMVDQQRVDLNSFIYPQFVFEEGFEATEENFDVVNSYIESYIEGVVCRYKAGLCDANIFEEAMRQYVRFGINILYKYGRDAAFIGNLGLIDNDLLSKKFSKEIFLIFKYALLSTLDDTNTHRDFWTLCATLFMEAFFQYDPYVDTEPRNSHYFDEEELVLIKLLCSSRDKEHFRKQAEEKNIQIENNWTPNIIDSKSRGNYGL